VRNEYGLDSIKVENGITYFKKERLQDIVNDCDWDCSNLNEEEYRDVDVAEIVVDKITDTTRWSNHYYCVFKLGDKYYSTHYSEGATEMQDESPYEYDGEWVEVDEVKPVEKTVVVYE
jgi:hypothetical protein